MSCSKASSSYYFLSAVRPEPDKHDLIVWTTYTVHFAESAIPYRDRINRNGYLWFDVKGRSHKAL